jgi:hypothetical protein
MALTQNQKAMTLQNLTPLDFESKVDVSSSLDWSSWIIVQTINVTWLPLQVPPSYCNTNNVDDNE